MGALRLLAALLAALRCLRLAIPCRHPSVRSCASSDALPHRPGLWYPGVPPALPSWKQRDLPGSWATRSTSALLSDPGRASVQSHCFRHVGAAPALRTTKAPAIILSWLNDTASVVAVYASSPGSPPTNARLASGCRLRSTGWDWLPTGWLRQVSDAYFTSSSPPRLGLARSESYSRDARAVPCVLGCTAFLGVSGNGLSGQMPGRSRRSRAGSRVRADQPERLVVSRLRGTSCFAVNRPFRWMARWMSS